MENRQIYLFEGTEDGKLAPTFYLSSLSSEGANEHILIDDAGYIDITSPTYHDVSTSYPYPFVPDRPGC